MILSGAGGSGPHSLSLHVARISRPTFDFEAPLRLDLENDFGGVKEGEENASVAALSSISATARAGRSLRSDPLDALEGTPGLLALRPQFGAVYLGEPFFAALSLVAADAPGGVGGGGAGGEASAAPSPSSASASSAASFAEALAGGGASDVSLRVELTADGGVKGAAAAVLTDTGDSPIVLLAPGQRHDCLLKHDVRCVGRHTLVAAASYTVPATGERRHLSQYFSFSAAAPLGVRTKVRPAPAQVTVAAAKEDKASSLPHPRPAVLVEATIDNARRGQCLSLEMPRFEASPGLEAAMVSFVESSSGSEASSLPPPPPPPPIPPNGAASFVWLVKPTSENGDPSSLAAAAASPAGLGRLDLRWRTPFGGAGGRLQTQGIAPPPSASRRVSLGLRSFESATVPLERPFKVVLSVTSRVDAAVGPLRLEAASSSDAAPPQAAAAPSTSSSSSSSSSVVLLGPPTRQVTSSLLPPRSSVSVTVSLLALQPGVQRLPALRLVDCGSGEGSTLDVLSGWVMVSPPSSSPSS